MVAKYAGLTLLFSMLMFSLRGDRAVRVVMRKSERQRIGRGDALPRRHRGKPLGKPPVEFLGAGSIVSLQVRIHARDQLVGAVESLVDGRRLPQVAQEQAGADEQADRARP